jgi:hypothetical protein
MKLFLKKKKKNKKQPTWSSETKQHPPMSFPETEKTGTKLEMQTARLPLSNRPSSLGLKASTP